jgi:hypothetical protein
MIWSLYGSTGDAEISWFHALSAGNISIFSASANVAEHESFGEVELPVLVVDDGSFLQLKINIPKIKKIHLQENDVVFIDTNLLNYAKELCQKPA